MQRITLRIILRTVFGVEAGARLAQLEDLVVRTLDAGERGILMIPLRRDLPGMRWRRFLRLRTRLDAVIHEEIARRRADPGAAERTDVLSLLVGARDEDGRGLSDSELRDELMTLLVAGHETTATALSWALERLLRHPGPLARRRAELAAGEEEQYLEAVVQETLRARPVLDFAMRWTTAPLRLGDFDIPAETTVGAAIHLIGHREDLYPEPRAFRPDRFLERPPETYAWIPFGGGTRRCLGAAFALFEMKAVLRAILTRAELRAADPRPERARRRAITWVPARGARAVLVARRDSEAATSGTTGSKTTSSEGETWPRTTVRA
jgi:cytochrome P450